MLRATALSRLRRHRPSIRRCPFGVRTEYYTGRPGWTQPRQGLRESRPWRDRVGEVTERMPANQQLWRMSLRAAADMPIQVVVLLALLLTGCPAYQLSKLPASEPLAQPRELDQAGSYRHVRSNREFPASAAGFERIRLIQFDTAGLDVSASYQTRSPSCPVLATLYVYPAPRMHFVGTPPHTVLALERSWLASEYARSRTEIFARYPEAQMRVEVDRPWFIKHRHTFPISCARKARKLLDVLHMALRQETEA